MRPAAARTRRPSDQEVVASVLQGDAAACRELVSRYERSVYDLIYHIVRDPDDTQDLTQETFLKTFKALPDYDPKLPFSPWIATIANNTARDYKRRSAVHASEGFLQLVWRLPPPTGIVATGPLPPVHDRDTAQASGRRAGRAVSSRAGGGRRWHGARLPRPRRAA